MSVVLNLTPREEAQLSAAASQTGTSAEEFASHIIRERLFPASPLEEMRLRLRKWREQDVIPHEPAANAVPAKCLSDLFAEWDREDQAKTTEEREQAEAVWRDFQTGIDQERQDRGMRRLF